MRDPLQAFREAILAALGYAPEVIEPGKLHRFATSERRGDDAGWCKLFDDLHGGVFGCHRQGVSETWSAADRATMTREQRAELARQVMAATAEREAQQVRRQSETASTALASWQLYEPATVHPYLERKGVHAYGTRCAGTRLVIPMRDTTGKLHGLQTIDTDGEKRFTPGGRVRGCYHAIGRPSGTLIVAEGFATGASIHEATWHAVAVAFNAGNLEAVAKALRGKYPCVSILIAGDDDWRTPGNPGMTAASQAALAVGGIVVRPIFPAGRPNNATDFNDLHALAGIDAVRRAFAEAEVTQ